MNPASRILDIYKKVRTKAGTDSVMFKNVFANACGFPENDENLFSTYLSLFRTQIDLAIELLKKEGCPQDIYSKQMKVLKQIFSLEHFRSNWVHMHSSLSPDIELALAWSSWVLGNTEPAVDSSKVNQLIKDIENLEVSLENSSLPENTISLLNAQLETIKTALQTSCIAGFTPVERALHEATGAFIINQETIKKELGPKDKISVQIRHVFNEIAGICGNINNITGTIEKGQELSQRLIEIFSNTPVL